MQKIFQLSSEEAHKIAAGEVVERPANIVKELIENAIDAGGSKISLHIERGGHARIKLVDNGCGMNDEDAERSFLKHATSKVKKVEDLSLIKTFGFRGEALASIASIAKVTLTSKEEASELGIKLTRHGLETIKKEAVGCADGTTIDVQDLFYNVPARKKFLKKEETEWRAIVQLFQAHCLDYQSIHFQLYKDGSLIHNCPPTKNLSERMIQLWDHSLNAHLIEIEPVSKNGITVSGIISDTQLWRYNRNQIFFLVNNRWIKNFELSRAITKAYAGSLPKDRHPVAAIFITVDPETIDVNIHPRKEEIKFLHPQRVSTLVFEAVKQSLEKNLNQNLAPAFKNDEKHKLSSSFHSAAPTQNRSFSSQPFLPPPSSVKTFSSPLKKAAPFEKPAPIKELEQEMPTAISPELPEPTIIGVAHKTYIIVEHKDGLFFVDQHAAHERILFEQFSARFKSLPTIQLLFPTMVTLSKDDIELLINYQSILEDHGIHCDQVSDNQIAVKSTPVHLKHIAFEPFIKDIIEEIKAIKGIEEKDLFDTLHRKLRAQMACKAAVKAGDSLNPHQIKQLITDLQKCENNLTCPHGRPTGWLLSQYEIEKKFKRIG